MTVSRFLTLIALAILLPRAAMAQAPGPGPLGTTPPAPVLPRLQSEGEALAQDAAEYARQFGVPQIQAERRLRAQAASVAVTDGLAETWRDRLAGITIEHRPAWRVVVHLTGTGTVPPQRVNAGGFALPVVFQTGAKATRERLLWAVTYHLGELRTALGAPAAMGLDPRAGELVAIMNRGLVDPARRQSLEERLERIAGVPVQLRLLDRTDVNLAIEGGSRVEGVSPENGKRYYCTTGFAVTDGQRQGMLTAAHCLDGLSHIDPQKVKAPLSFVGQWGWGYQDVQVHLAEAPVSPSFFADTARTVARPVTGARPRLSTRSGDFICHRGESTGYSCATVDFTDFAPAGELCGGACLPTWVTVTGPGCRHGDSGGPVFSGTTAYGILKGASYRSDGSCAFYFYMSTDYIPHGWSLMISSTSLLPRAGEGGARREAVGR